MKSEKIKTIALISGGLDSATATGLAIEKGHEVIGLSFDYGQRHVRELNAAKMLIKHFNIQEHFVIDIDLKRWGGSTLTDLNQDLPSQGVIQDKIPSTYVPGRNTIFLAIGLSLAETKNAKHLVIGVNSMDYSGYPDCRPDYIKQYQILADLGSKSGREGNGVKLWAPLINWTKIKILEEAVRLGIPIDKTWSCYAGQQKPCGVCDSCRIRDEALRKIGLQNFCSDKEL